MLLDTDVISATRFADHNRDIIAFIERHRAGGLAIPSPVIGELSFGVAMAMQPARRAIVDAWLGGVLRAETTVDFTSDDAVLYGEMLGHKDLRAFWYPEPRAKRPRLGVDLQLAAMAIVRGDVLATLNLRHFARIKAAFPALEYVSPRPHS